MVGTQPRPKYLHEKIILTSNSLTIAISGASLSVCFSLSLSHHRAMHIIKDRSISFTHTHTHIHTHTHTHTHIYIYIYIYIYYIYIYIVQLFLLLYFFIHVIIFFEFFSEHFPLCGGYQVRLSDKC